MSNDCPKTGGAYIITVIIDVLTPFGRGGTVQPGTYLYVGSAYGPGGLAARLSRHARKHKRRHWHIDALTEGRGVNAIRIYPGSDECVLARELAERCRAVKGFGSSDCDCPSHLFRSDDPEGDMPPGGSDVEPSSIKAGLTVSAL
ncbi:MAG: GIY-YIG nuclease family protein [Candidatus Undinarchaeales archaeon]|nr:GIY-YIG nuclease family protein [Candidatus Undinarchaeales archaeon]MDP7493931.1 GIY-YIG nuclease family protein [Candidatus Undinarchaeales archaeon]